METGGHRYHLAKVDGGRELGGCTQTISDSPKEFKGEFECKDIEGVSPTTAKTLTVTIKGSFSAAR